MGRWQGHQHAGAPPRRVIGSGAPAHTAAKQVSHEPYVCAGAAQSMFHSATAFNQPLEAWDVGNVSSMQVRCRLRRGLGLLCTQLPRRSATHRARVLVRRSICSTRRLFSTSLWLHGMLARSPTWWCAAARVLVGCSCARSCRGGVARAACVLAWRSLCSTRRLFSTSLWLHGTLARSPT